MVAVDMAIARRMSRRATSVFVRVGGDRGGRAWSAAIVFDGKVVHAAMWGEGRALLAAFAHDMHHRRGGG
ncbi:MAG: hypothetical protein QOG66_2593 [Methylobacteriaceae bacterium]|nr:hypothetical protein [Methylobacteriaceae bacterium]